MPCVDFSEILNCILMLSSNQLTIFYLYQTNDLSIQMLYIYM